MQKLIFILLVFTNPVLAHDAAVDGSGFLAGISHPVLGFDHFLAMVSVGIVSAQIGGRAIWSVPASFVLAMLAGGVVGMFGHSVPFVEITIVVSVLLLGVAIALPNNFATGFVMLCVAFFGFFHGHAHGMEMPSTSAPVLYAIGFMLGTIGLHLLGVLFGWVAARSTASQNFLRHIGSAIAGIGAYLFFEYIPLLQTLFTL